MTSVILRSSRRPWLLLIPCFVPYGSVRLLELQLSSFSIDQQEVAGDTKSLSVLEVYLPLPLVSCKAGWEAMHSF